MRLPKLNMTISTFFISKSIDLIQALTPEEMGTWNKIMKKVEDYREANGDSRVASYTVIDNALSFHDKIQKLIELDTERDNMINKIKTDKSVTAEVKFESRSDRDSMLNTFKTTKFVMARRDLPCTEAGRVKPELKFECGVVYSVYTNYPADYTESIHYILSDPGPTSYKYNIPNDCNDAEFLNDFVFVSDSMARIEPYSSIRDTRILLKSAKFNYECQKDSFMSKIDELSRQL